MKSVRLFLLMTIAALALTACSSGATDGAKSTPTPRPAPTEAQTAATQPASTADVPPVPTSDLNAQTDIFIAAGDGLSVKVGAATLEAKAYRTGGEEKTLLLPVSQVCRALGWKTQESETDGKGRVSLTQEGMEEIVISYEAKKEGAQAQAAAVTASRGGKAVSVENAAFSVIDGQLYASERFISETVQRIEVNYDGDKAVTVNAKA